jgi:hypothetical protein
MDGTLCCHFLESLLSVIHQVAERDVVLVFVLKKNLPSAGGQAAALAKVLDRWAQEHPDPYLGPHWPST